MALGWFSLLSYKSDDETFSFLVFGGKWCSDFDDWFNGLNDKLTSFGFFWSVLTLKTI